MEPTLGDEFSNTVNRAASIVSKLKSQHQHIARLNLYLQSPHISSKGKAAVANHIIEAFEKAGGDEVAAVLGVEEYYRINLISAMKSNPGKPTPSPTPDMSVLVSIDEPHQQANDPQNRLPSFAANLGRRDCLREQVTHLLSRNFVKKICEERGIKEGEKLVEELAGISAGGVSDAAMVTTQGCHIIPLHLAKLEKGNSKQKLEFWSALYSVFPELHEKMSINTINQLSNGVTLSLEWHTLFGDFDFGLKYLSEDLYEVVYLASHGRSCLKDLERVNDVPVVRFVYAQGTKEEDKVSRELLQVHLAIATIYHAMGGAEALEPEDASRDEDEITCLSSTALWPGDTDAADLWSEVLCAKLASLPV